MKIILIIKLHFYKNHQEYKKKVVYLLNNFFFNKSLKQVKKNYLIIMTFTKMKIYNLKIKMNYLKKLLLQDLLLIMY